MVRGHSLIPATPRHRTPTPLAQAAALQDQWYEVADLQGQLEVFDILIRMDTLAEDLEVRLTIDSLTAVVGAQAGAVAGTNYHVYVYGSAASADLQVGVTTNVNPPLMTMVPLKCRTLLVEVRKTSNNGANTLRGNVLYARY